MLDCYSAARLTMNHNDRKESGIGPHGNKFDMKSKSYKSSDNWNHHYHSRNSAEDPGIASSRTDKHVLSNARNHPQADAQGRSYGYSSSEGGLRKKVLPLSNHVHNHVMEKSSKSKSSDSAPFNGKRRRSLEEKEGGDNAEGEWTEHVSSSSGRTYYYNKKLDKSQWEPPQALLKKARLDPTPQSSSHSKSASASTNHDLRRGEGGGSSRSSTHSRGNSRERSHSHKDKSRRDGGGGRDSSSSSRRGAGGHEGNRKRHRDRRSVSHSNSSSPVGSSKYHSTSSSSNTRGYSHKGTTSAHSKGVSSGRSHCGGGARDRGDKSRQSTPGRRGSRSNHASPSAGSTPKASVSTPGIQLISPTTPGSTSGIIPISLSQTLSNTQHLIEQNSLLIEQRQKFLTGESVSMASPTCQMTTPTSTPNLLMSTPPTHLHQPMARKRLSLSTQQAQSPPGPIFPVTMTTPTSMMGGVPLTGGGTPVQSGQVGGVPTTPQGTPNLHPLQKALLLQNQQQQQQHQQQMQQQHFHQHQQQPQILPQQLTPTSYMGGGMMDHSQHVTPTSVPHATPTALPHHMTSLSYPSSPRLQSPLLVPPATPPLIPSNIRPLTPAQQPSVFNMPVVPSPNMESVVVPTYPLVSSALLQRPVSRLGYQGVSMNDPSYPGGSLEMGVATRVDGSYIDRGLLGSWSLQAETAIKQMDQCRLEAWRRRVVDATYHSGRLAKRRLSLESAQVRTFSRGQRLACVQSLLIELDKR